MQGASTPAQDKRLSGNRRDRGGFLVPGAWVGGRRSGNVRTLKTDCGPLRGVLVAITGTPGTGKTSACDVLEGRGYVVVDLDEIARREGCIVGRDDLRGSEEVDVDRLRERLRIPSKLSFLKGHYSHLLDVNVAIVLRCSPGVLRRRLEARGWPAAKVRENVEAEAIDLITQEAVERAPLVYEVDTSHAAPRETAATILEILQGRVEGHGPGSVDWSHEVLSWF